MINRPNFNEIKNYEEFKKYYWYREELKQICKSLNIEYNGTKLELNNYIKEYFNGNIIKKKEIKKEKNKVIELTLDTKLIECGFSFNQRFRDFFSEQTKVKNFKFNTDMVATAKKVKQDKDSSFTLQDMLDVYYGKLIYAVNDNSACEWNKFLKDFCNDPETKTIKNKLNVASKLWNIVRESDKEKIYTTKILKENYEKIIK